MKSSRGEHGRLRFAGPLRKGLLHEIAAAGLEIISLCFCFAFFPFVCLIPKNCSALCLSNAVCGEEAALMFCS